MSNQPFVSVIVVAYRQEKFIREAVRSALAQTYENLEIILSDDSSPDRTFEIMKEETSCYQGPHKLILNRNSNNLGVAGNLNSAAQLASGDLFVIQDGDDISFPNRTSRLVQRWINDRPRRDLIYSRATRIAADGSILPQQNIPMSIGTLQQVARGKFFIAGQAVSAYSRALFEKYGPLNHAVVYTDYVLTFRALLGTGCAFVDEPLVYYRVHENSIIQSTLRSEKTRRAAAHWAKHAVAEAEDRLHAFTLSEKRDPRLRRRLARDLAYARLDACSSSGSRFAAFECFIRAMATGRPNAAWIFLRRDLLNWNLE